MVKKNKMPRREALTLHERSGSRTLLPTLTCKKDNYSQQALIRRLIRLAPVCIPANLRPHLATEKRSLEYCIRTYPEQKRNAANLIARIVRVMKPESLSNLKILEVGAAQGSFVFACNELSYCCEGIEPSRRALDVSRNLAKELNVRVSIEEGIAEELPYPDGSFDIVIALSVIEHVGNVRKAFSEAFRVLKPGGAFYFETASSLCPYQDEIRFFPFFSWYPDKIKLRILRWTSRHRPSWVGYTETPAINWFTPQKACRLLREAGFRDIHDRWSLLAREPGSFKPVVVGLVVSRIARMIDSRSFVRLWADVLIPACAYLAIKARVSCLSAGP